MNSRFLSLCLALAAGLAEAAAISLQKEVARAQDRGLAWLLEQQEENGSWRHHPAITALAVTSALKSGKPLSEEQQAAVDRGLKFILANVKPDGAIYGGGETDKYPNYSTAICAMALVESNNPKYNDVIRNARRFLIGSQFDESEGIQPGDPSYGGIGYGRRERPDLSNTSWALEALHLIETRSKELLPDSAKPDGLKLHWSRAVKFLERCQNLPSHNDQPWAKNATDRDLGGFIYMPGFSFANEGETVGEKTPLRSYGSMSYAGLKSYIYADLKKDDPRVVAALNWLKRNYTLDENPGLGSQGVYYYYHTFAKALTAYGEPTLTDADGKSHDWREEFMAKLVSLQQNDGFWVNQNGRWWENDPVLVTCYCLIALGIVQ